MALLAAYNFDEASGTILDASGNGRGIALSGDLTRVAGHTNTGLGKSGATDMTPVAPFGQTATRTVMAWCWRDSGATQATWIVGYVPSSTGSGTWGLIYLFGELQVRAKRADNSTVVTAAVPEPSQGVWHHVAGTYDGSDVRLYLDGSLAATTPAADLYAGADELYLLLTAGTETRCDGLRIYDEALDEATIASLMDTPVVAEPTTTPVGVNGSMAWHTRSAVPAVGASAWRTRALTTVDAESAWRALATAGQNAGSSWRARARAGRAAAASWRARLLTGAAGVMGWRTRAAAAASGVAAWKVSGETVETPPTTYSAQAASVGQYSCTARTVGYAASPLDPSE